MLIICTDICGQSLKDQVAQLMEQWANGPAAAAASSSSSSKILGGGAGAGGFSKPKRCRFWPRCTKGDDCPFIHPRELCKNWPKCSFSNECFYIHPQLPCKFGKDCSNAHCNFSHETGWDPKKNYQAFLAKKAGNKGGLGAAASGGEGAGATDDSLVVVPNKDDDGEEEETHAGNKPLRERLPRTPPQVQVGTLGGSSHLPTRCTSRGMTVRWTEDTHCGDEEGGVPDRSFTGSPPRGQAREARL
uniref:C3H1-type domain-containing protein n=1 Tax=Chromera velia CCMP2878 TaxID=1169474 RepID=A0A0G4HDT6_9ALVE|eukprot:Cvel_6444.t1-p1 / transcript=Cvel_6444.t1 / gene=Cvel_6444 / organism=Chromera_velia_CCMP2878 / gene_product=Zinc finger CCCH domain-containing protein 14, putative / transcript_product=Zinc finger CCCH domain-containing protein 14, putative / location=Cvel_scaffold315:70716-72908(-) / protein_length=244 / sequence_SO=supercontig / SO=protein_coding / is_pseudo=false